MEVVKLMVVVSLFEQMLVLKHEKKLMLKKLLESVLLLVLYLRLDLILHLVDVDELSVHLKWSMKLVLHLKKGVWVKFLA